MSLACFGAYNDHMTLPNNVRGNENTYIFFLYQLQLWSFFITCKQTSCSTLTVPDLDHFRKILKNSTESMVTVNTTSPLSWSCN